MLGGEVEARRDANSRAVICDPMEGRFDCSKLELFPINEREANGRLIAAAPDLLAALQTCTDKLQWSGIGANPEIVLVVREARAAIAKATA